MTSRNIPSQRDSTPRRQFGRLGGRQFAVTPATGAQLRLATRLYRHHWRQAEALLGPHQGLQLLSVGGELAGCTSLFHARLHDLPGGEVDAMTARQLLRRIEPAPSGGWAVKSGLFFDRRLTAQIHTPEIASRIGPVPADLARRTGGLNGYIAAVLMHGQPGFAPAVDPLAYLQQVEQGSVSEPLLSAYLRCGARPVAVVTDCVPPVAVVWFRS